MTHERPHRLPLLLAACALALTVAPHLSDVHAQNRLGIIDQITFERSSSGDYGVYTLTGMTGHTFSYSQRKNAVAVFAFGSMEGVEWDVPESQFVWQTSATAASPIVPGVYQNPKLDAYTEGSTTLDLELAGLPAPQLTFTNASAAEQLAALVAIGEQLSISHPRYLDVGVPTGDVYPLTLRIDL